MTDIRSSKIKPRGAREIIADIAAMRFSDADDAVFSGGTTLLQDLEQEANKMKGMNSVAQEVYGHPDPMPHVLKLKDSWEWISTHPETELPKHHRDILSSAYDVLGYIINAHENVANNFFDDQNPVDASLELKQGKGFVLDDNARARHLSIRIMEKYEVVQNLLVELCDHYSIPTKRNPPQRKRS